MCVRGGGVHVQGLYLYVKDRFFGMSNRDTFRSCAQLSFKEFVLQYVQGISHSTKKSEEIRL